MYKKIFPSLLGWYHSYSTERFIKKKTTVHILTLFDVALQFYLIMFLQRRIGLIMLRRKMLIKNTWAKIIIGPSQLRGERLFQTLRS